MEPLWRLRCPLPLLLATLGLAALAYSPPVQGTGNRHIRRHDYLEVTSNGGVLLSDATAGAKAEGRGMDQEPSSLLETAMHGEARLAASWRSMAVGGAPLGLHVEAVGVPGISGHYVLVPDKAPHGFPLWQQANGGSNWLFTGSNGHWFFGGDAEEAKGFECEHGLLATRHPHSGHRPDSLGVDAWLRYSHGRWRADSSMQVNITSSAVEANAAGTAPSLADQDLSRLTHDVPDPSVDLVAARSAEGDASVVDVQIGVVLHLTGGSKVSYRGVDVWDLDGGTMEVDSEGPRWRLAQDYTQCAWVLWRPGDARARSLFRCNGPQDHTVVLHRHSKTLGFFSAERGEFFTSLFDIDDSRWNFVCVVGRGDESRGSKGTSEYYVATADQGAPMLVGTAPGVASGAEVVSVGGDGIWPGKVAMMRTWAQALTGDQIRHAFLGSLHIVGESIHDRPLNTSRVADEAGPGKCKPCQKVTSLVGPTTNRVLADHRITASSYMRNSSRHGADGHMERSRIDWAGTSSWVAGSNRQGEYIEADFGRTMRVTKVITKGQHQAGSWVTKYAVGAGWPASHGPFPGNSNEDDAATALLAQPLEDTYVRLFPLEWNRRISLRWDVLGCECDPVAPLDRKPAQRCEACGDDNPVRPLVGPTYAKAVPDSALSASSHLTGSGGPTELWRARLDFRSNRSASADQGAGAWVSGRNVLGEYVEARFVGAKRITAVLTRGRSDADEWVTAYQLGQSWQAKAERLVGNTNSFGIVEHILEQPLEVEYIRLYPLLYHGHMSLRFDLMGCECRQRPEGDGLSLAALRSTASMHGEAGDDAKAFPLPFEKELEFKELLDDYEDPDIRVDSWRGRVPVDFRGVADAAYRLRASSGRCHQHLLGMGKWQRLIPDTAIVVSSAWDRQCGVSESRLHGSEGLCLDKDLGRYYAVFDLGIVRKIEAVQTQGATVPALSLQGWVTEFSIEGSTDGQKWSEASTLPGNIDVTTVRENSLNASLEARYVRLTPKQWHGSTPLLRTELLGCSDLWALPDKLSLGKVSTIEVSLIYPRWLDGRVFYYLDGDGDGQWKKSNADGDTVALITLAPFLPADNKILSDTNNIIIISGYKFRVPDALTLDKLLTGAEEERGTAWPAGVEFSSSSDAAYDETVKARQHVVVTNRRRATQTLESMTKKRYTERNLLALELLYMPGQADYQKFPGKCKPIGDVNVETLFSPRLWHEGSDHTYVRAAQLGTTLACEIFCSAHAHECKGFIFDHSNQTCVWLKGNFKEGDAVDAETYSCFISKVFSCDASFESCGEGFVHREAGHWCAIPCAHDECCVPKDVCTPATCGHSMILKDDAPEFCQGSRCTVEECCNPLGTCTPEACPKPAYRFKLGNLPKFCTTQNCTPDECCHQSWQCEDRDCPAPFALRQVTAPVFCEEQGNARSCSLLECCVEVGSCHSVECDQTSRPKSKDTLCANMTCRPEECCEFLGSCKDGEVCPAGFRLKDEQRLPGRCDSPTCTVEECCENVAQCVEEVCPKGFSLKNMKGDRPHFCRDIYCAVEECCEPAGRCEDFTCGRGHRLLKSYEGRPDFCKSANCSSADCCKKQGQCVGNICTEGSTWMSAKHLPLFCEDEICRWEECCERLGVCTSDICGEGYRKKTKPRQHCKGSTCTAQECCVKLARCSDSPELCAQGRGFLPKLKSPEYCNDYYCEVEECCDIAPQCTHDVCDAGTVLQYTVYCKKASGCTSEECCAPPGDKEAGESLTKESLIELDDRPEKGSAVRRWSVPLLWPFLCWSHMLLSR
eukprot:TRINITY_DN31572_c2_g3_i1.p1 TRINITY_DN31572_c2_g3~~TRINITY_DN31572_c2_g3_i1.p1  ORF type:complete len:1782 (-),score=309.16 TRINITY_DN31572_c2_g3_i1:38-5383(-)